jgi:hypothetical protein
MGKKGSNPPPPEGIKKPPIPLVPPKVSATKPQYKLNQYGEKACCDNCEYKASYLKDYCNNPDKNKQNATTRSCPIPEENICSAWKSMYKDKSLLKRFQL